MKIWALILISIIISGCAGIFHQSLYAPALNEKPENDNPSYNRYHIDLLDAHITVFPVVISEKLNALIGPALILPTPISDIEVIEEPLILNILVQVKRGVAILNLWESKVKLGTNLLYPEDVLSMSILHYPGKRSEYAYNKVKKELILFARHTPYRFTLTYGIDREDLEPFSLKLGSLKLNGESIFINPISFSHASRYRSK